MVCRVPEGCSHKTQTAPLRDIQLYNYCGKVAPQEFWLTKEHSELHKRGLQIVSVLLHVKFGAPCFISVCVGVVLFFVFF